MIDLCMNYKDQKDRKFERQFKVLLVNFKNKYQQEQTFFKENTEFE